MEVNTLSVAEAFTSSIFHTFLRNLAHLVALALSYFRAVGCRPMSSPAMRCTPTDGQIPKLFVANPGEPGIVPNDPQPSPQTSDRPSTSQGPPVISTTHHRTSLSAPCPQPRPRSPARSGPSGAARPHPHRCCCTARAQPAPLPPSSTRQRCPTGRSGRYCPVRARVERWRHTHTVDA